MLTNDDVQAALIAYLKSKTVVTSLLTTSEEIRECEWQGTDFVYPNIRVGVDLFPNINGCGPDKVESTIYAFSEEKSSLQANTITGAMAEMFHKHPFHVSVTLPNLSAQTLDFPVVVVRRVMKATRSIYGWQSQIDLYLQVI